VTGSIGSAPYHRGVAEISVSGRQGRVLVDTAGSDLCIRQSLADELGLIVHDWVEGPDGATVAVVDPPALAVGDAALDTEGLVAYAFDDVRPLGLAARHAEVLLPATVLRRHHIVLDDPGGSMHVGPPGSLERRGVPVAATVHAVTGAFVTSIEVDDEVIDLVIDTAVGCSLATDSVMRSWQSANPGWPASASAIGPANMTGLAVEARVPMLRVPLVQWGPFSLPDMAFAWRSGDTDVAGSLGANALRLFRLDLDWSAASVRVEQGEPFGEDGTEVVGVVLGIDDDGAYAVTATVSGLDEVRPGDQLLAVDGRDVADLELPGVLAMLQGTAGDRHRLSLRRGDEALDVVAPVLRLLH
jgi:hypothetical protein